MTGKKIIIACDGTWVNSDNGFQRTSSWFSREVVGHLAVPTDVTRICRALEATSPDGKPQLTYYQAGVGSGNNWYSFYIGGFLGEGISENIREAYVFLCNNYEPGDEIYLLGFSRGAFTARSIGGLIEAFGLLTKKGLEDFYVIFNDWEYQNDPNYYKPGSKNWIQAINIPDRVNYAINKQKYVDDLVRLGLTRPSITVEATAVWDTVGTLGIPTFVVPPLSWIFNANRPKKYAFVNTEIPKNLRHAYQALALDERREPFSPTIWELPGDGSDTQLQELKQCWFAGSHAGVGGSEYDTGTADVTLAWIIQQLSSKLTFDPTYLSVQRDANLAFLQKQNPFVDRPWSCGKVYHSGDKLQNLLVGAQNRTPGEYKRLNPITGKATAQPLRKTHEFVHTSVRVRRALGGLGTDDKGKYNSPWPLNGWKLISPGGTFAANTNLKGYSEADLWGPEFEASWKWVKQAADGKIIWLAEDKLAGVEYDLIPKEGKVVQAIGET